MISILKLIAKHFKMWKILLTCFKINKEAMAFYDKSGFRVDAISPSMFGDNSVNYEILSHKTR